MHDAICLAIEKFGSQLVVGLNTTQRFAVVSCKNTMSTEKEHHPHYGIKK
jgi:hypothetical protein